METKIRQLNKLEELANKNTIIHNIHPACKIVVTLIYIIIIISFDRYKIGGLLPYFFYTFIIAALSETPNKIIFKRLMIALPFSFFAGISNIIFDKQIAFYLGNIAISYGFISFLSLIIKTYLTVTAAILLMATTKINDLSYGMTILKIPSTIVLTITMIYRYILTFINEASTMYLAYILRAPNEKGIKMKDMGSFVGQILLRSIDKSERVYLAMKCRGFTGSVSYHREKTLNKADCIYMVIICTLAILFRIINFSSIFNNMLL